MEPFGLGIQFSDLALPLDFLVALLLRGVLMLLAEGVEARAQASDLVFKRLEVLLLSAPHQQLLHQASNFLVHLIS